MGLWANPFYPCLYTCPFSTCTSSPSYNPLLDIVHSTSVDTLSDFLYRNTLEHSPNTRSLLSPNLSNVSFLFEAIHSILQSLTLQRSL